MSAHQILRTGVGNVVAVFRTGRGRNRAGCSCGWDGPLRMLLGWALVDAWSHSGRSPGCLPSNRLVVDEGDCHSLSARALWRRLTPAWVIAAMPLLLIPAGIWLAPLVHADPLPSNCEQIRWGFLGSQTRQICDGPIRPDGSWERERVIGVPSHYRNASSSCYSGTYTSNCTFYPAGWVDAAISEDTTYIVFPSNVLDNEPGHLG